MGEQICSIEGCGKRVDSRGWCRAHYRRWQRHGDPLGGTASKGALMQWVMDVAMAHEADECLTWPFGRDGHGRGSMHVDGKHIRASRYICMLAHGEPETPDLDAAHSCGNGHLGCVAKKHLRWATAAENMADSIEHGTFVEGEKSPHAKIKELDVHMIRVLTASGFTHRDIAERFGLSAGQVGKIALRQKWPRLSDFVPAKERQRDARQ